MNFFIFTYLFDIKYNLLVNFIHNIQLHIFKQDYALCYFYIKKSLCTRLLKICYFYYNQSKKKQVFVR